MSVCYRGTAMCVYWWGEDRETIIQELRAAVAEAVGAMRPITADEVTSRDIVELPEEAEVLIQAVTFEPNGLYVQGSPVLF